MNYTILHLHSMDSNPFSGLQVDSITPFQAYIPEIVKAGMNAVAFTEHGSIMHNVLKTQLCEKNGIKHIFAEEFYVTHEIIQNELVRDNYHCLLFARNMDGISELAELSSRAFEPDGHIYYNPRITLEELEHTSDNIMILTGCLAGMLSHGTDVVKERFLKFILANKDRCWLEIQPHNFDEQIAYNKYLYELAQAHDLRLIATNDIHAIDAKYLRGRKMMQKAKNIVFNDEDECDLSFKTYDGMIEAFRTQAALPDDVILEALEETNRFAAQIEPRKLDYTNKYPRFENSIDEFKRRIVAGIKERGIDKYPNFKTEYVPRIKEEFKTYVNNDAVDFILLDSDYKNWMRENNMHYGPSRGSVSGSLIAYLCHDTDVDSVKYKLNFSRFLNPERVSLSDVDTDLYDEDRYKVREYFFNRTDLYCCNILTFNTIKLRGAIKDIARAMGMTPEQAQNLCDYVYEDDHGNEFVPDYIRQQHKKLFEYVDMVKGTITSVGRHAAGIVCSPIDVRKAFGTLHIKSDPRPVSQIDMHEIDSLNFVKMDLLGLAAVGLIDKACKLAGIPFLTMDDIDMNDENVIKSIAEDTTLIFQFESGFASDCLKKVLSPTTIARIKEKNPNVSYLALMSMANGAIRPAGESYRDQLVQGIYRDNGNKALNDFLEPTLGFLVFQEQIIDFLHEFCGFTMGQADIIRRGFAKKTGTEQYIPIIKNGGYMNDIHGNKDNRYIKGYVAIAQEKYNMTEAEANNSIEYFLKVIEDASSYLFSRNHSDPYSAIGYFIGYLRYYYPIELLTAALNVYKSNAKKMAEIKLYAQSKGFKLSPIKFRKSRADYFMDKETGTIYQDIESIKEMNAEGAEQLYELRNNQYESFARLLDDIKTTCVNSKQLDILIKLDYFSEFGDVNTLLKTVEVYNLIRKRSQFSKDDLDKFGLTEDLILKYTGKETKKLYKDVDISGLLNEMVQSIHEPPLSIQGHIRYENELLGYPISKDANASKRVYYIAALSSNRAVTKLKLYSIRNGQTVDCNIWNSQLTVPISCGDFLFISKVDKKPRREPTGEIAKNGKKVYRDVPGQYEYWLTGYEIMNDEDF